MENNNCSFRIDAYNGHELKDGSYPIVLVVRKDDKRKTINLGISANIFDNGKPRWKTDKETKRKVWNSEVPCQWNFDFQRYEIDKRKRDLHPDRETLNTWLNELSGRCDKVIKEFTDNRIDWTLNQFRDALINKTKKSGIEAYLLQYIEKLEKAGKFGNKRCYVAALDMLKKFDRQFANRVFNEIDLRYVNRFSEYLDERGQTGNTKKYYIKTLRSILNKAIKDKECSAINYPFGKDGFSIAALETETDKRYLPAKYLELLKTAELKTYPLNWSRNLFLFSYYCQGMAIVDMAGLKTKNIIVGESGRYIVYRRRKTESKKTKAIHIKITAQIQDILNWSKESTTLIDDYLLPIVSIEGYTGQQLYTHVRDRYKKYNDRLKDLGDELKFEGVRLSSYMSRHSYAMRLKNSGIAEDVISQALGHKDLATTKTYLDSFENDVIAKANEVL